MHKTSLRRVGGSTMLAVPPPLLDILGLRPGSSVGVAVQNGRLVVEPRPRPRYSLDELLARCNPRAPRGKRDRRWLSGGPVGRELIQMRRGEIWLVALDPAHGHEQKGRRPVLIASPEAFNRVTRVPVVLPITSGGGFARAAGFAVSLDQAGTKTEGIVRCDQPRALDLRARGGRKLESVPDAVMNEVLARLLPIFEQRRKGIGPQSDSLILPEIGAVDLMMAASALGAITGEVSSEDVLDAIFRDFCIGK